MARKIPFPFIGGSYADDTRPWSVQDTVNYLPTPAESPGTRSEIKLKSPPGFTTFTEIGAGPIRGARNVEGRMYVVSGTNLVQINPGGSFTSLGSIPGVGPVSISHNQINGGNEVTFVNGNAGYVLNTITNVLTQITDDAYPGSFVVDYIDQYMVHVEPGRRYWFHSELANATSFNALDRYEAESSPDLITTLIVANSQVIVFGERTIQFFQNVGAATNTFVTSQNTVVELGCDAPGSVARIINTVIFKATDGSVYRLDGNTPTRISTRPIEQALAACNPANMRAYVWEDRGHKVYYLTCPDGRTWGCDLTTGLWHRRQSYTYDRWRLNTLTLWNRAWYGGDSFTGLFYQLDWDVMHEAGAPLASERIGPVVSSTQNRVTVHQVEFVMDTGAPALPTLALTGDLPGGFVGSSGSLQYVAQGGIAPYTFSIASGSLPPGATMDADGLVTYTYTLDGAFSWVVMVTDAFGQAATLPDSAVIMVAPQDIFEAFLYTGNGVQARTFGTLDMTGGGITYTSQLDGSTATGGSYAMRALPDEHILSNSTHNASPTAAATFTAAGISTTQSVTDGFNTNLADYSMALLRRLPGVFDVVFYTGNGANRTIAHDLGVVPGLYTIFRVSGTTPDQMFHRTPGAGIKAVYGNSFGSEAADLTLWNNTAPTTTDFSIGTSADVNTLGVSYMAILFAHDPSPMGYLFCGNYTGNGLVAGPAVVTGWTPRAILTFPNSQSAGVRTSGIGLFLGAADRWRALAVSGGGGALDGALFTNNVDGFTITSAASQINQSGVEYRFVAIR